MMPRRALRTRLIGWSIVALMALTLAPAASVTFAQSGPVRSQTVPDDDEPKDMQAGAPRPKPAAPQRRKNGYIQPGPDGVVRTDPIVEPGDPGYVGPLPPPRPRPSPLAPPRETAPAPLPEPTPVPSAPIPEPPKPEPPKPPAPQPVGPQPPKYVPPKPVLVPEPGDAVPQPQPQPATPKPQPPAPKPPSPKPPAPIPPAPGPGQEFIPPEAFPEPGSAGPKPPAPKPEQPTPTPSEPTPPQPAEPSEPAPQPDAATGLIDSGLTDSKGRNFTYYAPGDLKPGSGSGVRSDTIFAPGMRYPIESAPSFPNTQVYGRGGYLGPGGGLCDEANYVYPWRDNFCEKRGWQTPACPGGRGHQGQDIRAMDCKNAVHWVVAVEDGVITKIGSWSVNLKGTSGREYIYLHMRMNDLQVEQGSQVRRGQRIGKVSNDFGGQATSIHLHFEIRANVALPGQPAGFRKVPPYASLVDAYKRLLRGQP